ncbi:MAG: PorT family protein [Flavobacteriales bacterium]|nr:PorT family protein [Flavobacteriales bacterium]
MFALRHILSIALAVASVQLIQAQEFRLSGGYNGSNVTGNGSDAWTGQAGYQFGADLVLGGRWFLKPGVHFLVRNLEYSYATTAGEGPPMTTANEFRYTSRALLVPVMLGVHLIDPAEQPGLNLYALGGPSALMNLSADLDNDALEVTATQTQWYLGFGAGAELGFLFVEGGYDVAMNNVFKGESLGTDPRVNFVRAQAGVRLKLAR